MARLAGVNIPTTKKISIALTYIYGLGLYKSLEILERTRISPNTRTECLSSDEVRKLGEEIKKHPVEGDLRSKVAANIRSLREIKSYRGIRHYSLLPVRGQRTHTNAMTRRKGKRIAVTGKKKA